MGGPPQFFSRHASGPYYFPFISLDGLYEGCFHRLYTPLPIRTIPIVFCIISQRVFPSFPCPKHAGNELSLSPVTVPSRTPSPLDSFLSFGEKRASLFQPFLFLNRVKRPPYFVISMLRTIIPEPSVPKKHPSPLGRPVFRSCQNFFLSTTPQVKDFYPSFFMPRMPP